MPNAAQISEASEVLEALPAKDALHVELGRRYHFAASHRLHSGRMTEEENASATILSDMATTTRWKCASPARSIPQPE